MRLSLFKLIWKINAVLFLILGLIAVGTLLILSWSKFDGESYDASPAFKFENVPQERLVQENWQLNVEQTTDEVAIITLLTGQKKVAANTANRLYSLAPSQPSEGAIRNILFFDFKEQKSHWLYDNNDERVIRYNLIVAENRGRNEAAGHKILGIRYLIEAVKNNDTNESKGLKIAFSDPRGRNLTFVVDSADRSLGYAVSPDGLVHEFFIVDGVPQVVAIDSHNFKKTDQKPLL